MSFLRKNCCDGIYNSFDVHFTSFCDNKCAFCVDAGAVKRNKGVPDVDAILATLIENCAGFDDVLVLGGEPCLYLDELLYFTQQVKAKTHLKVYVTSSMPKTCHGNFSTFEQLLRSVDGFNISAQHHDESVADSIRGVKSQYDRQAFYAGLPFKSKIRINLNIVKGLLSNKKTISDCLLHYDAMGFGSFKLSEIQHDTRSFVPFTEIFGTKMPAPYSSGCQTFVDMQKLAGIQLRTPVLLKRSCFICEKSLKASFMDGVKIMSKLARHRPLMDNSHFGVIYEDGSLENGWVKE